MKALLFCISLIVGIGAGTASWLGLNAWGNKCQNTANAAVVADQGFSTSSRP